MSSVHDSGWNGIYHRYRCMPWELGKPRSLLVELVEEGHIVPCKTLDLCCGLGTNPMYLTKNGFDVTALDISHKAVEYAKEKVKQDNIDINLLVGDFVNLPFNSNIFRAR